MSLNGLDEAKVAEAHQAALAEAGGWFLLKYTTRDTVELLSRGAGGVAEVRSAITAYAEKSPLYGLVQFRRKKIVLKYVPDGTSRLLQVRLTVQFQSVLETFVPHDTVLSFAAPSELTDSALTSACMLHPSQLSLTSSSSSLRRQPLGEISEDVEESPHVRGQSKSKVAPTPSPPATNNVEEERKELVVIAVIEPSVEKLQPLLPRDQQEVISSANNKEATILQSSSASTPKLSSTAPTPTTTPTVEKSLPTTPEPTPPTTRDGKSKNLLPSDQVPELLPIQQPPNLHGADEIDARASMQSTRPSLADAGRPSFSNYDSYDPYKPKIKRGPRPHVETETRPQTAGSAKKPQGQRLVANLPTSVRTQTRSATVNTGRPGSQQSSRSVPSKFIHYSESAVVPPLPSPNHISSLFLPQPQHHRSYSRAGSITSTATAAATPEKLRLMKALQMRKRNQQQAKRESEMPQASEESKAMIQSQTEADVESARAQPAMSSGAERTSASRMEEAAAATAAARMATPTSMTNVSDVPSTQSSSFIEDRDGATSHASISSDTSSSVTPKADAHEAQQHKQARISVPAPKRATEEADVKPAQQASRPVHEQDQDVQPQSLAKTAYPKSDGEVLGHQESAAPDEQSSFEDSGEPVVNAVSETSGFTTTEDETRLPTPNRPGDGPISRRRGADLEPIKVVPSSDLSEASDDDSFLEELQHAQVQQAKPVAVGRSPVTPIYHSLSSSAERSKDISRTVSSPLNNATNMEPTSPGQARPRSIRSVSTALPSWPPANDNIPPVPLAKKGPLSSGISKRIKALEVFTAGRESSSNSPPASPSHSTIAQKSKAVLTSSRKRMSFIPGGNTNISTANPPSAQMPTSAQIPSAEPADHERGKSLYQGPSSAAEYYTAQQKGETISVTARIIRNPNTIHEDFGPTVNDSQPVPLQRSKLTFEHERPDPQENRPAVGRDSSTFSTDTSTRSSHTERARPSFSSHRSDSQPRLPTSDSMASRLSAMSGKKKDKANFQRSNSDNSSLGEEKSKQSRARRLMQRVSNLSTNSRRNIAGAFSSSSSKDQVTSDTITEQSESEHDLASVAESVSHVVDIGDVNVQFPDTLLWKRRFLRIDDQGYLIFTPPTDTHNPRNINRKFHLSEFKKPTLPDVERAEMAWSILLDTEDGSCIQCACESKYTQTQVLRMLVDAHSAYHQLYSG